MITYPSPTTPDPISAIPPDIAKAIVLVKKDVKTIVKDAENKHGNYKYASVDAVYEGVREGMATHGLCLLLLETGFSPFGEKSIRFEFQVVLFTAESTWTHATFKRSIVLPWNGPQTAQAAQSYVEKAVLKSLFKLDTGDAEPEGNELGEAPKKDKDKDNGKKAKAPEIKDDAAKRKEVLADLDKTYPKTMGPQDANDFAEKWAADFPTMSENDKTAIRDAIKVKRQAAA
jgi:hypothetical protein